MSDSKRKRWTREEPLLFLSCYAARKAEFSHARKKRFAFANVLEDMISQGFSDVDVTTTTLEAKLRTLLQAFKFAKDNARQTGNGPSPVPFMDEMEEIFGRQPIISNSHTLNLSSEPVNPLQEGRCRTDTELLKVVEDNSQNNPPAQLHVTTTQPRDERPCFSGSVNPRKRKSTKEKYYEAKLKIKEKLYSDVKEMIGERLKQQNLPE